MTDVRWGFLGAGGISRTALAPAVHAARGAVLQSVGARDAARAADLGPIRAYSSYDEVLADPDVDAVYIGLNNDAHLPWTVAALAAGKPVLCEKPLGLSVAEVDEMSAMGGLLVEASWYRWHPRVIRAQELIAEGRIGRVRRVRTGFTFAGVDAGNYRLDPARGGGALYDVGCYAVSAAVWAFGGGPDAVTAHAVLTDGGVDATTRARLHFAGDGEAEVTGSISTDDGQWLVIDGDAGSIVFDGAAFTSRRDDETELQITDQDGSSTERFAAVDPYQLMVEAFSDTVRGTPAWLLPLPFSRAVAAVLDAVRRSADTGGSRCPVE